MAPHKIFTGRKRVHKKFQKYTWSFGIDEDPAEGRHDRWQVMWVEEESDNPPVKHPPNTKRWLKHSQNIYEKDENQLFSWIILNKHE